MNVVIVHRVVLALVLLAAWLPETLVAGEPPPLAHNPFSRPPSQEKDYDLGIVQNDDGSGATLALRATMVGPARRLANVAGRVLTAGDEIEGYRLVAIHEDYAVFEKGSKAMIVYVKPQPEEDND